MKSNCVQNNHCFPLLNEKLKKINAKGFHLFFKIKSTIACEGFL